MKGHRFLKKFLPREHFISIFNIIFLVLESVILKFILPRIKEGFDKLSESLKAKLTDAKEFVKATVNELLSIPQDVLSSLQVSYIITAG